jgi:hypothetical protein
MYVKKFILNNASTVMEHFTIVISEESGITFLE